MNIEGPHVEQNHASLKAIAGDDKSRSLEQNIVDVMDRTCLLLQKRQSLKYKWSVEAANDLRKMDAIRRAHLNRPRNELSQRPYKFWVQQYDMYTSYTVEDCVQDGVPGARVRHTSNSNDGYFIPDGGVCPCEDEWAMMCGCRHKIAKSISRREDPFCKEDIHRRHLFVMELPTSKASDAKDKGIVQTDFFSLEDCDIDHSEIFQENLDVELVTGDELQQNGSQKNEIAHESRRAPISTTNNSKPDRTATDEDGKSVFASPSRIGMSKVSKDTTAAFCTKVPSNIDYKVIQTQGNRLASLVGNMSNEHRSIVYSMLAGMCDVLESCDYDQEKYYGTSLEVFVKQLDALCGSQVQVGKGMPKVKKINSYGPPTKHRLGSAKSTVTGKRDPPKCTFCGGGGGGVFHSNKSSCPLKIGLGDCIDVKKVGKANVGDGIDDIFKGRFEFLDAAMFGTFDHHHFINDELPHGTKRVQIKAYLIKNDKQYLLCTCIGADGNNLQTEEGSKTVVYENIFLSKTALSQNLSKCDYVFYKPLKKESAVPTPTALKSPVPASVPTQSASIVASPVTDTKCRGTRSAATAGRKRIQQAVTSNGMDHSSGQTSDSGASHKRRRPRNIVKK